MIMNSVGPGTENHTKPPMQNAAKHRAASKGNSGDFRAPPHDEQPRHDDEQRPQVRERAGNGRTVERSQADGQKRRAHAEQDETAGELLRAAAAFARYDHLHDADDDERQRPELPPRHADDELADQRQDAAEQKQDAEDEGGLRPSGCAGSPACTGLPAGVGAAGAGRADAAGAGDVEAADPGDAGAVPCGKDAGGSGGTWPTPR